MFAKWIFLRTKENLALYKCPYCSVRVWMTTHEMSKTKECPACKVKVHACDDNVNTKLSYHNDYDYSLLD